MPIAGKSRKSNSPGRADNGAAYSELQRDIAERLGERIVSGDLPAGARLGEKALAASFEVSRTPVRAALRLLCSYKLTEYRPAAGFFVRAGARGARLPAISTAGTTSRELYQAIVTARAQKQLPEAVTEKEMLSRYPASRSLLHKTLVKMAADGLLEKRRGHGWRFLPSLETPEAIAESYRFRLAVECTGLLEPTFEADAALLKRMKAAHEEFLRRPKSQQTVVDFLVLNSDFHEMLAKFSGNRFILQSVQQQNQLRRLEECAASFRHPQIPESCREHLRIIEALEGGDRDWAAAILRHHLNVARARS